MADLILDNKVEQITNFYSGSWAKSNLLEEAYEVTDYFPDLGEKGKWFRITSAAIRDPNDNIFGVMETLEDITEQKMAEEELLRRSKVESLGTFADGVAKDFDSLLTAILRNVFLAKISATDEDKIMEDGLAVAERAGLQAKELAHRLTTFAQGGYPVHKVEKLEPLLREAAENVFNDSGVTCNISIAKDLWPSEIDAVQIRQVIENILINAKEGMTDGGTMELIAENTTTVTNIRTLGQGNYIRIIIKDNGIGIPRENLSRIFDPYFTTKEKKERGGIGLGLAISDSIIKNHKGLITVESIVNSGTTFSIYLAAVQKNAEG
jgi:signal transduction histidine kinase